MNRVLMFWIATLLVFCGAMLVWTVARHNGSEASAGSAQVVDSDVPPEAVWPKLTEFELLDQTGKRVNSHELDGHVWAGSFFFASCPGACYNQNIKLQELYSKYADRGFQMVSITCDPGKDTPVALSGYASRFNANADGWKFLTPADADMQYIQRIANDFFGVAVASETHTDRVVLFDRQGNTIGAYSVLKPDQFRELDQQIEKALSDVHTEPPEVTHSDAPKHSTDDQLSTSR